jgi:3-hydroxyisobutyrate dehydrogenase
MDKQRIGFIGLGAMGIGMASKLAESGYEIAVYNRTRGKSEAVGKLGARVAESAADVAKDADVVMLSLADQNVVGRILFDDTGVFGSLREGGYVVDMSTVPPGFARDLAARARSSGYRALDACVLGNPQHAREGELRVMVGGDEEDFDTIEPILQTIGKEVTYLGSNGMGATMKLVLNMLMGVQMPALAEAVVFGERAGLPRAKILEMIAASGYSSPVMKFRCGMMGRRAFGHAAFKLGLMRKDMMLVLSESQDLDVPMPVSEAAYASLTAAKAQGLGDFDVAAILAFQERLTGMEDYPWPDPSEISEGPPPGMGGPPPGVAAGGPPPGVGAGGGPPEGGGPPS